MDGLDATSLLFTDPHLVTDEQFADLRRRLGDAGVMGRIATGTMLKAHVAQRDCGDPAPRAA